MLRQSGASALALLLAVASVTAAAAEESYVTDPAHSQPSYEIRHTIFSTQRGDFTKSTGKITIDREAKKGSIDVSIDTTSIRSHDPRLDSILKGEDYFNVAKYPTMTFKSTVMRFDGDRLTGVDGELTMIGVTRPVTLKVADFQCGENPFNKKPMLMMLALPPVLAQCSSILGSAHWIVTYIARTLRSKLNAQSFGVQSSTVP